jgi:antitoxin ParD1/3/4
MIMAALNISLPDALHEFIESQVADGGYGTASEYISTLVREAQRQKARERVEALLLEGINSGEPIEVNAEYWEEKHCRLREGHVEASDQ